MTESQMLQRNSTGCFFREIFCQRWMVLQVSSRLRRVVFPRFFRTIKSRDYNSNSFGNGRIFIPGPVCRMSEGLGGVKCRGCDRSPPGASGMAVHSDGSLPPTDACGVRIACPTASEPGPRAPGAGEALLHSALPLVLGSPTWTGSSSTRGILTILRSPEASFLTSWPTL